MDVQGSLYLHTVHCFHRNVGAASGVSGLRCSFALCAYFHHLCCLVDQTNQIHSELCKIIKLGQSGRYLILLALVIFSLFYGDNLDTMQKITYLLVAILILSACAPAATSAPTIVSPTLEATAAPVATSDKSAYLSVFVSRLTPYLSAYGTFFELHRRVDEDRSLLLDTTWATQMETALEDLDNAALNLETISQTPPDAEKANEAVKKIGAETHLLVAAYRSVFAGDESAANAVNQHIENLNKFNELAAAEISKFLP